MKNQQLKNYTHFNIHKIHKGSMEIALGATADISGGRPTKRAQWTRYRGRGAMGAAAPPDSLLVAGCRKATRLINTSRATHLAELVNESSGCLK